MIPLSVALAVRDFPCTDCGQPAGGKCQVASGQRAGREMLGIHKARKALQLEAARRMRAEARA